MSYEDGVLGTKELTKGMVTYRVSLIRAYDRDPGKRPLPLAWGNLTAEYLQMRQNLKALPEDADCREDEAWTCNTFVIQGIWTSGLELNWSEFN
eukprot:6070841-Pleurochrysis_carterae.AAC.1